MAEKMILVSCAAVARNGEKGYEWFLVKQGADAEWELPKTVVRRGESSVRAVIRAMGEQGGMRAKVLEEIGRGGGAAKVNGRPVTKRYLFYLMFCRDGNEVLGYEEAEWLEYSKALKKLTQKKDQEMIASGKILLKELEKKNKQGPTAFFEEEEEPIEEVI